MSATSPRRDPKLEAVLEEARRSGTSASLRAEGEVKMLGHLHVHGLEPGTLIQLDGAKLRDALPAPGTPVILTLIQGEEVISIRTRLLEPGGTADEPPLIRAAWPVEPLEARPRREVRVATPDLPPLDAVVRWEGRTLPAKLVNLTDMGMGLGFTEILAFQSHDRIEVETNLPGDAPLTVAGAVRHAEVLEEDELPMRVGLVLTDLPAVTRETLQRFIQARRMDRSYSLRGGH